MDVETANASLTLTSSVMSMSLSTAISAIPSLTLTASINPSPTSSHVVTPAVDATQFNFTDSQLNIIQIGLRTIGSLSFLGNMSIICSYLIYKRFQTTSNRLIFYMSMAEIILATACIFGDSSIRGRFASKGLCTIQGFMINFTFTSTMLWNTCMALQCLLAVNRQKPVSELEKYHSTYNGIVWGIGGATSVLAIMLSSFYNEGDSFASNFLYCWINPSYKQFRLILFYGPLWVTLIINIAIYCAVVHRLNTTRYLLSKYPASSAATAIDRGIKLFVWRTSIYIFIFTLNWVIPTVNRIQNMIPGSSPQFKLYVLHGISIPIGGFLNAIAYFYFTFKSSISSESTAIHSLTNEQKCKSSVDSPPSLFLDQNFGTHQSSSVNQHEKPFNGTITPHTYNENKAILYPNSYYQHYQRDETLSPIIHQSLYNQASPQDSQTANINFLHPFSQTSRTPKPASPINSYLSNENSYSQVIVENGWDNRENTIQQHRYAGVWSS